MKTLITGCILFKGQGQDLEETVVSELYDIYFFKNNDDASEFGESYLDDGGDSYLVVNEKDTLIWADDNAINVINTKNIALRKELSDAKRNGALTSSYMDEIAMKLDSLWSLLTGIMKIKQN